MKRCRSIWRAMRRGHPVNFWTGTYRSRKETTKIRQTWIALNKKAKTEDNGNDSE